MKEQPTLEGKIVVYLPSSLYPSFSFPTMNGKYVSKAAYVQQLSKLPEKELMQVVKYITPLYTMREHSIMKLVPFHVRVTCSPERYLQKIRKVISTILKKYEGSTVLFVKDYGNVGLYAFDQQKYLLTLQKTEKETINSAIV